jgi:hypothetical protein
MAAPLATLLIKLATDTAELKSGFQKAISDANNTAAGIKSAFLKVGSAIGIGLGVNEIKNFFTEMAKSSIDAGDRLKDLATRTGLSGNELLALEAAAQKGGGSLESISDVTSKLSKRTEEAARGQGEMAGALQAMGLSALNADGSLKGTGQLLEEIGKKFRGYEDGANKASLATAAFGKGGDKLIPVVEGIEEARKRFERLGITISSDFMSRADQFNDTLVDLKALTDNSARAFTAGLLPSLQSIVDKMVEFKESTKFWEAFGKTTGSVLESLITSFVRAAEQFTIIASASDTLFQKLSNLFALIRANASLVVLNPLLLALPKSAKDAISADPNSALEQTATRIREINKEIETLSASPADFGSTGGGAATFRATGKRTLNATANAKRIADLEKERESLFAREEALSTLIPNLIPPNEPRAEKEEPKTQAPRGVDLAQQKAAAEAAAKALEKLIEDQSKRRYELIKTSITQEESLLDLYHGNGLIEEQSYWTQKLDIARRQTKAEQDFLSEEIKRQEASFKKAAPNSAEYYNELNKLEQLRAKLADSASDLQLKETQIWENSAKAARDYKDSVADLQSQLLRLQGRSGAAVAIDLEKQQRPLRTQAELKGDTDTIRLLNGIKNASVAQADFNDLKEKYSDITTRQNIDEQRIQNTLKTGAISELDAMMRTSEVRKQAVTQYQEQLAAFQRVVDAVSDPSVRAKMQLQVDEMAVALQKLSAEADVLAEKFGSIFSEGVTSGLDEFYASLQRGEGIIKSLGNAFKAFATSVGNELNKIASREIANSLANAIGLKGEGGLAKQLAQFVVSGFGGNKGTTTPENAIAGALGALGQLDFSKSFKGAIPTGEAATSLLTTAPSGGIDFAKAAQASDALFTSFTAAGQAANEAASGLGTVAPIAGDAVKTLGGIATQTVTQIALRALASAAADATSALLALASSAGSSSAAGAGGGGAGGGIIGGLFNLFSNSGGGGAAGAVGNASLAADVSLSGFENFAALAASGIMHGGYGPGDKLTALTHVPRFHTGTGPYSAAIKPHERAAIILKSESVLTQEQMRELVPVSVARAMVQQIASGKKSIDVPAYQSGSLTRGQVAQLAAPDSLHVDALPRFHSGTGPDDYAAASPVAFAPLASIPQSSQPQASVFSSTPQVFNEVTLSARALPSTLASLSFTATRAADQLSAVDSEKTSAALAKLDASSIKASESLAKIAGTPSYNRYVTGGGGQSGLLALGGSIIGAAIGMFGGGASAAKSVPTSVAGAGAPPAIPYPATFEVPPTAVPLPDVSSIPNSSPVQTWPSDTARVIPVQTWHTGKAPFDMAQSKAFDGLRDDERLAVILKSEAVLTEPQMRELAPVTVLADYAKKMRGAAPIGHSELLPKQRDALAKVLPLPKFHTGVGPGERTAIIRDSESVLTRGQMSSLASVERIDKALASRPVVEHSGDQREHALVVTNNFTIQGNVDRRSQQEIAAAAMVGAQRAIRRNK